MYVIRYCDGIYAGIWSDMDGNYCYSSNSNNKCKPKIFKTYAGVKKHLEKLKAKVPFPDEHNFIIEEWSEMDLQIFLDEIGVTLKSNKECSKDVRNLF